MLKYSRDESSGAVFYPVATPDRKIKKSIEFLEKGISYCNSGNYGISYDYFYAILNLLYDIRHTDCKILKDKAEQWKNRCQSEINSINYLNTEISQLCSDITALNSQISNLSSYISDTQKNITYARTI